MAGSHIKPRDLPDRFSQTPSNPVAFDRIALAFGHRVADAGRFVAQAAIQDFQQEVRTAPPLPATGGEKFGPLGQSSDDWLCPLRQNAPLCSNGPWRPRRPWRRIRRRGACAPGPAGWREPCGHPWWPGVRESHDGACAQALMVERYALSFILMPRRAALLLGCMKQLRCDDRSGGSGAHSDAPGSRPRTCAAYTQKGPAKSIAERTDHLASHGGENPPVSIVSQPNARHPMAHVSESRSM